MPQTPPHPQTRSHSIPKPIALNPPTEDRPSTLSTRTIALHPIHKHDRTLQNTIAVSQPHNPQTAIATKTNRPSTPSTKPIALNPPTEDRPQPHRQNRSPFYPTDKNDRPSPHRKAIALQERRSHLT